MFRSLIGLALLLAAMSQAPAQEKLDCDNAVTQLDMTQCAYQDWQSADAELNTLYKAAMDKMHAMDADLPDELKGAVGALRDAQRAWIPYRDKACESYGFLARGGSMEPMLVNGCRADLTRSRIEKLQDLMLGLGN